MLEKLKITNTSKEDEDESPQNRKLMCTEFKQFKTTK